MPSKDCKQYYIQLHNNCRSVIEQSFTNSLGELQATAHNYLIEYEKWLEVIAGRPEHSIFERACREYQFALLTVSQGLYRQAFMALRLFVELVLGGIQLSTNELELRLWLNNRTDTNWNSIVDEETGIFSARFLSVFCPELHDERGAIRTLATQIYRECSEHVHGNPRTSELVPEGISFSEESFRHWHSLAKSSHFLLTFMFTVRYFKSLTAEQKLELETIIMDVLGHYASIRSLYEDMNAGNMR
jgi:hypothetical protein